MGTSTHTHVSVFHKWNALIGKPGEMCACISNKQMSAKGKACGTDVGTGIPESPGTEGIPPKRKHVLPVDKQMLAGVMWPKSSIPNSSLSGKQLPIVQKYVAVSRVGYDSTPSTHRVRIRGTLIHGVREKSLRWQMYSGPTKSSAVVPSSPVSPSKWTRPTVDTTTFPFFFFFSAWP